jgi:hypothetical protein
MDSKEFTYIRKKLNSRQGGGGGTLVLKRLMKLSLKIFVTYLSHLNHPFIKKR